MKIKAIYYKKFLKNTSSIPEGEPFGTLPDRTNFYTEAGGQKYDTVSITIDGVAEFEVFNVQAYSGYILHIGYLKYGQLSVEDEIVATFDVVRQSRVLVRWL